MGGAPGPIAKLLAAQCPPQELRRMRDDAMRMARLHLNESRIALGEVVTITSALAIVSAEGSRHGKAGTYNRGCRCDPCRRAKADYQRTQRHRAKQPEVTAA